MKKLILFFLVSVAGSLYAADGTYTPRLKDSVIQQEFENVYRTMKQGALSQNSTGYNCIDSPTFCVDSVNHKVVTSTETLGDGTAANPSLGFASRPTLGLYKSGSAEASLVDNGSNYLSWGVSDNGVVISQLLDMSTHRIVNVASATAGGDAARYSMVNVVRTTFCSNSTAFTTTSASFQSTNLSCTHTFLNAADPVTIEVSGNLRTANSNLTPAIAAIFRGTTNVSGGGSDSGSCKVLASGLANNFDMPCSMAGKETPGSGGAVTYVVKIENQDGVTTAAWGNADATTMIIREYNP